MPQLNEGLMDFHLVTCFFILYSSDCLTLFSDLDDDLLEYHNVILLV